MKFVLRLIGILAGLSVVYTLLFILRFGEVGMQRLLSTGTLGVKGVGSAFAYELI